MLATALPTVTLTEKPAIDVMTLAFVAIISPSASPKCGVTGADEEEPPVVPPVVVLGVSGVTSSFFLQAVKANVPAKINTLNVLIVVFIVFNICFIVIK